MATPQRNFPNDERPEPRRIDPARTRTARTGGGRSLFWIWIVLFIAAILWFCGWGWGGYGGWWWGRTPAAYGPAYTGRGAANGNATGATGNGTAAQHLAAPPPK
ncbi:MAG: hypothetical protein WBW84_11000 [Acidobacteriaceae bacterium]